MGPAKASLESCARYLAAELVRMHGSVACFLTIFMQGPEGVRVNCLSPGPMTTAAARSLPNFNVN